MLLKAFILMLCSLHIFGAFHIPDCDLHQITEDLLQEDTGINHCLDHQYLNLQRRCNEIQHSTQWLISTDISRGRLESCSPGTVGILKTLLDDAIGTQDDDAINAFLNAVVDTPVMTRLDTYLRYNGLIDVNQTLHQNLKEIWFTSYKGMSNDRLSSGFSHVFEGEVEGSEVMRGFTNWIRYLTEQVANRLQYLCYHKDPIHLGGQRYVIDIKFRWKKVGTGRFTWKNRGGIFLGTTPELEMALYTLCFYARPHKECPVKMNNKEFRILTCEKSIDGMKVIHTAFPVLSELEMYCT